MGIKAGQSFGIDFEAANHQADIMRWRNATLEDRSLAVVQLLRMGSRIAAATGVVNMQPAPDFPKLLSQQHLVEKSTAADSFPTDNRS